MASHGLWPWDALTLSRQSSDICKVLTANEKPICMYGRTVVEEGVASFWLLGTHDIAAHRREFMRLTQPEIENLHAGGIHTLYNYVDARHLESIRWLKWAGAGVIGHDPAYGVAKIPFLLFAHF